MMPLTQCIPPLCVSAAHLISPPCQCSVPVCCPSDAKGCCTAHTQPEGAAARRPLAPGPPSRLHTGQAAAGNSTTCARLPTVVSAPTLDTRPPYPHGHPCQLPNKSHHKAICIPARAPLWFGCHRGFRPVPQRPAAAAAAAAHPAAAEYPLSPLAPQLPLRLRPRPRCALSLRHRSCC